MLELDECDQILVTNPFADDSSVVSSSNNHDAFVTLTRNSSSERLHHPLRSRSVSPARSCNTRRTPSVIVTDSEGETRPRVTSPLSSDELSAEVVAEEDHIVARKALRTGSDTIVHFVGPNDSFAGVALRYGVSIAALRRANQLWPSDPIHIRTELVIPRGETLRVRRKPTRSASTTTLRSALGPASRSSPDLVASSLLAARNMIFSVLPARLSMESLSSKASTSEDHEMDDFQKPRAHKVSATDIPCAEEGFELSILATPRAQHKRFGVPLPSQELCSPADRPVEDNRISPVGDLHSRSISSSSIVSVDRRARLQPFATLPVRTSQLEPEPAMELPIRRPRTSRSLFLDGRYTTPRSNASKYK